MKKILIGLLSTLQETKFIESQLTLIDKSGVSMETTQLTPSSLTQARYLYFYEKEPS